MKYNDFVFCWKCNSDTHHEIEIIDDDSPYQLKCKDCGAEISLKPEPEDVRDSVGQREDLLH